MPAVAAVEELLIILGAMRHQRLLLRQEGNEHLVPQVLGPHGVLLVRGEPVAPLEAPLVVINIRVGINVGFALIVLQVLELPEGAGVHAENVHAGLDDRDPGLLDLGLDD